MMENFFKALEYAVCELSKTDNPDWEKIVCLKNLHEYLKGN